MSFQISRNDRKILHFHLIPKPNFRFEHLQKNQSNLINKLEFFTLLKPLLSKPTKTLYNSKPVFSNNLLLQHILRTNTVFRSTYKRRYSHNTFPVFNFAIIYHWQGTRYEGLTYAVYKISKSCFVLLNSNVLQTPC